MLYLLAKLILLSQPSNLGIGLVSISRSTWDGRLDAFIGNHHDICLVESQWQGLVSHLPVHFAWPP